VVAPGTAHAGEALGALPDVFLHLLVDQLDILPTHRLGDAPGAEVVEAGRGAGGHTDPALVAAVEVVGKAHVGLHQAEQPLLLLVGDVIEPRNLGVLVERRSVIGHCHQNDTTASARMAMSLKAAPPIITTPSIRSSRARSLSSSDGWQTKSFTPRSVACLMKWDSGRP